MTTLAWVRAASAGTHEKSITPGSVELTRRNAVKVVTRAP